jgi:hypothetical protein
MKLLISGLVLVLMLGCAKPVMTTKATAPASADIAVIEKIQAARNQLAAFKVTTDEDRKNADHLAFRITQADYHLNVWEQKLGPNKNTPEPIELKEDMMKIERLSAVLTRNSTNKK